MNIIISKIKDPGSAITHFIAFIFTLLGAIPLINIALDTSNVVTIFSIIIFITSMLLLYAASTVYHTFNLTDKINKGLKKFDHMMIFVLIAGTYTPICLMVLKGTLGLGFFIYIWSIAILGIIFKAFWVHCPKWISSVIYIGMGWSCLFVFAPLYNKVSSLEFYLLLLGGVIYTIGGVLYALKLSIFNKKHKYFGSHEIFHLFVMGGSLLHFILMFYIVANFS